MQKLLTLSLVLSGFVFAQEPSAFDAGRIVEKKSEIQVLDEKLFNLSIRLKDIEESQEGFKSVLEGQLQKIQNITNAIELSKSEHSFAITEATRHVDTNFALQDQNIESIKESISALAELIKRANDQMQEEVSLLRDRVSIIEKSFQINFAENVVVQEDTADAASVEARSDSMIGELSASLPGNLTEFTGDVAPKSKELETHQSSSVDGVAVEQGKKDAHLVGAVDEKQSADKEEGEIVDASKGAKLNVADIKNSPLADIFRDGEQFYKTKDYDKSIEYLQVAINGNHRPAHGNYLLGEIAFEQKRYEDAIYYYKTSATLYDKAEYMPRLMFHSAKSLQFLGEGGNAKLFLETLVALYPQSNEAEEAKELLK